MTTRENILAFLANHKECVMATVDENGRPQAATVGFSETPQLGLTIGTSKGSRKYQNILRDPHVAVVVGFEGNTTVQYQGTARELNGEELLIRLKLHFQKIPDAQHFQEDPDQVYLAIDPTWVRYTDYSQLDSVEELREFV